MHVILIEHMGLNSRRVRQAVSPFTSPSTPRPGRPLPGRAFEEETLPSATSDKSSRESQPSAIDEIDFRVSPHHWGHQPQTGHIRRCVPLDRKCLLVNRKLWVWMERLLATGEEPRPSRL